MYFCRVEPRTLLVSMHVWELGDIAQGRSRSPISDRQVQLQGTKARGSHGMHLFDDDTLYSPRFIPPDSRPI